MQNFDDATAVTMQTYQHIAPIYAETHARPHLSTFWRERMQRFVDLVRSSPAYQANQANHSLPILDIGCGPGRDSLIFAEMGFEVIGADLSEAMLVQARASCENQPAAEHITFRRMDMRSLSLPDASCAALWASASFLHIPKRENLAVLQEMRRVLVPNGPITVLVKECDDKEDERYDLDKSTGDKRFFARYRGSELWALLEQADFLVIDVAAAVDQRFPNFQRWIGALAIASERV